MRCAPLLVLALAGIGCPGCVVPVSQHPLSDDATAVVDERLIGQWLPVDKSTGQTLPKELLSVGRAAGTKNGMEVAFTKIDDQQVKVTRLPFFVTKADDKNYISLTGDEPSKGYIIIRYQFGADQQKDPAAKLTLHGLSKDFIVQSINSGKLKGEVEGEGDNIKRITITAPPAEVLDFLKQNDAAAFAEEPSLLQRVPE